MAAPLAAQTSDIVIKQYDDGGIYEGTFRNGLQHGTGTYTLPNGYQYSGDWVDGEIRATVLRISQMDPAMKAALSKASLRELAK